MIKVSVTENDYAQIMRELGKENATLRAEKAALSRVAIEMDTKISAMEAEATPVEAPSPEDSEE